MKEVRPLDVGKGGHEFGFRIFLEYLLSFQIVARACFGVLYQDV